jgi:hypothetical protein
LLTNWRSMLNHFTVPLAIRASVICTNLFEAARPSRDRSSEVSLS